MNRHNIALAIALIALLGVSLKAQNQHANQARGFSANGVYSTNDVDSVNLFNGNLILHIPVGNSYQVSSDLSYRFMLFYNSNLWTQREVCDQSVDMTYENRYSQYASEIHIDGINVTILEADRDPMAARAKNDGCYTFNEPNAAANAGMGWQLTFGKLFIPRSNFTDTRLYTTEKLNYVYQTSDGSEHTFYQTLHEGEANDSENKVWYTRDGSYLRLRLPDASESRLRIEFSGGVTHYFTLRNVPGGQEYRVTRMTDQFGNWVSVDYQVDAANKDLKWTISDSAGRTQTAWFNAAGADYQNVLSQVVLTAPQGQTATYNFNYQYATINRAVPYVADLEGYKSQLYVPFLTSLKLPDQSEYAMPLYSSYDLTGAYSSERSIGIIRGMTLPTGAGLEWQYVVAGMDRPEGYGYFYPHVSSARSYSRSSVGVRRRLLRLPDGSDPYIWKYDPKPEPRPSYDANGDFCNISSQEPSCAPKEFVNTVTTPEGDRTVNYFSVYPHPYSNNSGRDESAWHIVEYGLPLTKYDHGQPSVTDVDGKRLFLSTQIYDGNSTADNANDDTLLRSVYVRYETDKYPVSDGWGNSLDTNARVAASRTIYHDDTECGGVCFTETQNTIFDGLGHYRRIEKLGNFDGDTAHRDDSQSVLTSYNAVSDEYRLNPANNSLAISYTPFPENKAWILDTYTQILTRDNGANQKSVIDFYFDTSGLLRRKRVYKQTSLTGTNPTPSAQDVVAVYDYTEKNAAGQNVVRGNLTKEMFYGGDKQGGLSTTAALQSLALNPYGYEYGMVHTYAPGGVLKTTQYVSGNNTSDVYLNILSVDRDIDARTGVVLVERDSSGDPVNYLYDKMWRVTRTTPRQGSRADVVYTPRGEVLPSGAVAARATVNVYHRPNGGGTPLDEERYEYDGRGYLVSEAMNVPDGTASGYFVSRTTQYNAMGWKTSVSEWNSARNKTEYLYFDPFGRPTTIRTPDGKETGLQYSGIRQLRRNVFGIMTPSSTRGVGAERNATSWENYDVHGRLSQVREPSGLNDQLVSTFYKYDEGGRVSSVSTTASVLEISGQQTSFTQSRSFDYDGLGNLRVETLPELGASGNGRITYDSYDSRGHVAQKVDGVNTLRYDYDAAERPTTLEEKRSDGTYRMLKQVWYYGSNNNDYATGRYVGGKMSAASRHNYIRNPYGASTLEDTDIVVTERYDYVGMDGRLSKRTTEVSSGYKFEQTFAYGPLGNKISESYPQCTADTTNCASIATPRTINYGFKQGLLTRVFNSTTNYASSITYHSNGTVNEIAHSNNLIDAFENDPNNIQRVSRIWTRNGTTGAVLRDTGTYQYDGAKNIYRIGGDWHFYDLVGRIRESSITSLGQRQTYRYDAFANLRTVTTYEGVGQTWERVKAAREIDTDAGSNRMRGFTYDAQGNVTGQPGATVFTYDALNMMKYAPKKIYIYGPTDERLWVSDKNSGVVVDTFTLRGLNNEVLREYQLTNGNAPGHWGWVKDYVYAVGKLLASETPYGKLDYHVDHLGSVRMLTNAQGAIVSSHQYWPFGDEDPSFSQQDSERLKFDGHERDQNAGGLPLDYMHGRYYHFNGGKFVNLDPARDFDPAAPQTWNLYSYVRNNPLNATDPSGRETKQLHQLGKMAPPPDGPTPCDSDDIELMAKYGPLGAVAGFIKDAINAIQESAPEGAVITVYANPEWTPKQMAEAREKTAALNEVAARGDLRKTPPEKRQGHNQERYKKAGGTIPDNYHVDHVHELQLGGADEVFNMKPLDPSVNTSFGSQIRREIDHLPNFYPIRKVVLIEQPVNWRTLK